MENVRRRRFYPPTALAVVAAALLAPPSGAQVADIGLSSVGAQRFGRPSLLDPNVDRDDYFGWALATGDFNGDGADDLAAGARGSDGPGAAPVDDCGEVVVRNGVPGSGGTTGLRPDVVPQG